MNKNIDVLCIGNATVDVFINFNSSKKINLDKFSNRIELPLGEKISLDEYLLCIGGNACNVSVGLSRLGFLTTLSSEIGNDDFSELILKNLTKENVCIDLISKSENPNPDFNVVLSFEGERIILDGNKKKSSDLLVKNVDPRVLYLTSIEGDWKKIFNTAIELNKNSLIVLNPGTKQIEETSELLKDFLKSTEIVFLNLSEAIKLTRENNPDIKIILEKLRNLGSKISVVTDGMNGSYAIDKRGNMFQIGVLNIEKPLERTGAGDSYASGFIYGFLNGNSIEECMRLGSINANAVIRKVGAQDGLLTKTEIESNSDNFLEFQASKI